MARSHAKIKCSIWRDEDWLVLTPAAKLLYVLVLSQPKLTLLGTLDLAVGRWASMAGIPRERCEEALEELEEERYVVVDRSTDELLVRSFTHHDLDANRVNLNLAKGMTGQWECLQSPVLRSHALHEMPDDIWEKVEPFAPADAVQTRRSAPLEPLVPAAQPDGTPELPLSSLLPPTNYHPPGDTLPVQADLEHPPTPKLDPSAISEYRSGLDALKQAVPHLVKGPAA